jgi:membrane protease YdiL (CAAX protease family)
VPVLEEIIFRGAVHKYTSRLMSRHAAVFLQALIFGFIHLNIIQGVYAFFLGVIIGYIYLWFDSIYVAIAVHVAFNGTNIALLYLFGDSEIDLFYFLIMAVIGFIGSMAGIAFFAHKKADEKRAYLKSGCYNRWQF